MGKMDPRVDAYIEKSAEFAQSILRHLRKVIHSACPEVEETMKWSVPHFDYHGVMCSMAAFKAHCTFGFWKGELIFEGKTARDAMLPFGRITSLADLPSEKTLAGYIKKARQLNDEGAKAPHMMNRRPRPELEPPVSFLKALKKHKLALAAFEGFSPSHKREYLEWIAEAKAETTRDRRIATAIEWMTQGKSRNWKYMRSE